MEGKGRGRAYPCCLDGRRRLLTRSLLTRTRTRAWQGKKGGEGEGTVSEGGPIAYSTGIAEVALPIEFKLRNIEATERAQQALEREGAKGQREEIGALSFVCGAVMPCVGGKKC